MFSLKVPSQKQNQAQVGENVREKVQCFNSVYCHIQPIGIDEALPVIPDDEADGPSASR